MRSMGHRATEGGGRCRTTGLPASPRMGGPQMKRHALLACFVMVTLLTPGTGGAGPITFLTALPVAKGQAVLRGQYVLIRSDDNRISADRDLTVQTVPLALVVGITSRLAIFTAIPVLNKSLVVNGDGGRLTRRTRGVGDTTVFGRYTVLAVNRPGSTFRLAPFGGLEIPTGGHDASDRWGALPRPLQLGSGSWDGLGGVAATWQTLAWELDASAAYRRNREADGFTFGDAVSTDVSFQYRVWPRELGAGVPGFLYGVVESNLAWHDNNAQGGIDDPNSGGTTWDVDVGVQFVKPTYILEAILQIPTASRVNGTALDTSYRFRAGARWNLSLF